MKRILSFYIIREVLSLFLLGIVIFTLVLLMGRLLSLTDLVISHGVPLLDVIRMIIYLVPSFLVFTIPMAFLLAVLLAFGRLSADNEITILKSSGLSLIQIIPPVMVCAVVVAGLALGASIVGVPWGNSAFRDLSLQVLKQNATSTIRAKVFWDEIPGIVMYTDRYDDHQKSLHGVIIHDGRDSARALTVFAREGALTAIPGSQALLLRLFNGSIHNSAVGAYRLVHFGEYDMTIGDKNGTGDTAKNEPDMWLSELEQKLSDPATPEKSRLKLATEYHSRFTFPCASLVFALLAVPLGIQNRRSGKSGGFAVSIAIILIYYVLMSVCRTLAERGAVPPAVIMWLPDILFFIAGCFFLRRASLEKKFSPVSFNGLLRRNG